MEKTWHQWNISPSLIAPIEKTWFYEGFFFGMVMVMLKDTMSVKISFMHYMKWIRVMLPIVFEEFKLVGTLAIFFLRLSLSIVKRSTLAKIWKTENGSENGSLEDFTKANQALADYYSFDAEKKLNLKKKKSWSNLLLKKSFWGKKQEFQWF